MYRFYITHANIGVMGLFILKQLIAPALTKLFKFVTPLIVVLCTFSSCIYCQFSVTIPD